METSGEEKQNAQIRGIPRQQGRRMGKVFAGCSIPILGSLYAADELCCKRGDHGCSFGAEDVQISGIVCPYIRQELEENAAEEETAKE